MYLAHKENEKKQELTVHLLEAGQYAQSEGEKIGIGTLATLCLQLHDAGKFSTEFQAYIKQEDDLPKRGAVNHSSAGAELLMQEFKNSPYHSVQDMRLLIELISYTITAHHGIYDCIDEDGEDKFEVRLNVVEKEKLEEIAAAVPTPFHIYDEKGIRENAKAVKEAFSWNPGFREYFAVKANPNPTLIKMLGEYDCGCDCSSYTELMLSDAMGFEKDKIMFSSNVTPAAEYQLAAELGAIINLDDITHIDFLEKTLGYIPKKICCRYNPGGLFKISTDIMDNPGDAKYGMTTEQIFEAFRILKAKGAEEFGIHSFLASNTVTNDYYPVLAKTLFELAVKLQKETGVKIKFINLSGGVGIPYKPDQEGNDIRVIGEGVHKVYDEVLVPAGMGDVAIYTEMGRFMMGPYGGLVTRAIHQKHIYKEYIGCDACAVNLMRPAMYGAYHHITVMGKEDQPCDHKYDVTGSLCENNDKFAIDRMLPEVEVGDLLFIHDTGAHGFSMGYNYNGKLKSAEVLLKEDGSFEVIRRAETPKDYFATLDGTPEYEKMFGNK